jgi:signal transduction histidine kinase
MGPGETELALLHVPRLAAVATSAKPAWLWSSDGTHLIWANAVGAAIFGAANASACSTFAFRADSTIAAQMVRLAASLPEGGQERLERLRGFSVRFAPLTCFCSRLSFQDGAAILIAAAESTGPSLPLVERARRLFANDAAMAVFAADGTLLHAGASALQQLNGAKNVGAIGLEASAGAAMASGHAEGTAHLGNRDVDVTLWRLGEGDSRVLVLTLPNGEAEAAPAAPYATASERAADQALMERREPLRFVWQTDGEGRFALGSDDFIALLGPRTIAACGRPWRQIAAELKLDPDDRVARAMATRDTFSAIELSWPIDDSSERLAVELSGLPVFDRDRRFAGYRGFGVCRDIGRINQLLRVLRHGRPIGFMPLPVAAQGTETSAAAQSDEAAKPPEGADQRSPLPSEPAPAANVVLFRSAASAEAKAPSLSAGERNAFRELAQELTARLRGEDDERVAAADERLDDDAAVASNARTATEALPQDAERALLDRVPAGVLVYRGDALLYANRAFLDCSGYDSRDALTAAGGLNALFAEPALDTLVETGGSQRFCIRTRRGERLAIDGRLVAVPWSGGAALALIVTGGHSEENQHALQSALEAAQREVRGIKDALERSARRDAQHIAAAKAEFIAKVSHEIRTPLNAMIGFAEVIMAERFGAIGNERYREYLNDIHTAGTQVVSLLNDLVDLSKVESGQLDLNFASLDLNDVTRQCVAVMQPQANRARIIIRSALAPSLSQIVADPRTVRQMVLNLLWHAIKFTGPGGQVIVSTSVSESGEAVLRVRDTSTGMHEQDIEAALDPFGQTTTAPSWGSGASGLGLPLTKALAAANNAEFRITSAPNAGTLVEVAFPLRPLAAQ